MLTAPPLPLTSFAGSDSIIQMQSLTVAQQGQRMIPVFAAAIGVIYNLPVPGLVLSREVVNGIFLGTIVTWDDARIEASNPGITFPNVIILRLVRSDSSGTTQAFDRALASFANVNNMWGLTNYWNFHPLKGSPLPTWPGANFSGLMPTNCIVQHCTRSICSPGQFVDTVRDVCHPCPTGTYADTSGQNISCTPCDRGHYSNAVGSALCSKCAEGAYQDEEGQTACKECPLNTRRFFLQVTLKGVQNQTYVIAEDSTATSINDCKCSPGYWLPESLIDSSFMSRRSSAPGNPADLSLGYTTDKGGAACIPCPVGASCPGFVNNLQTIPRPTQGYWGDPRYPVLFYECQTSDTCSANYQCGDHLTGRMCLEPVEGYFWVGQLWYLQCPTQPGAAAALTVFLTILVVFVWLHIMRLAEGSIYDSFDVGVKFLHLIGFIAQFPLRWHPNLDFIFLVLLIANLEVDFIGPQCIWPSFNSASLFFLQLMVPFAIVFLSTLLWIFNERYFPASKVDLAVAVNEPLLNKACLRDGTIRIPNWKVYATNRSIQVFGFMYQVLVYRTFTCFSCVEGPDGHSSFLKAAPDVDCGSNLHISMMVIAVIFTIVVLLGFPFYMIYLLHMGKIKNILLANEYLQTYGCFYQHWKLEYVWWETVILARKFLISIILALVNVPMFQGALTVVLIYVSILLHLSAAPYIEMRNNTLGVRP